jgi:hypothetical protein
MRRIVLTIFASVLVFSVRAAAQDTTVTLAPSTPAGAAADPPVFKEGNEFPLRVSASYQFTEFRKVDGMTFHQSGINTDFTGFLGHDFALEGDVAAGFGWSQFQPNIKLETSEIFYGGGVRVGPERTRFQPWGHVLLGGEHFRFSQYSPSLGSNNGFAYQLGLGADIRIGPRAFWRVEGEYLGTHIFQATQANYQFGTGIAFAF